MPTIEINYYKDGDYDHENDKKLPITSRLSFDSDDIEDMKQEITRFLEEVHLGVDRSSVYIAGTIRRKP